MTVARLAGMPIALSRAIQQQCDIRSFQFGSLFFGRCRSLYAIAVLIVLVLLSRFQHPGSVIFGQQRRTR